MTDASLPLADDTLENDLSLSVVPSEWSLNITTEKLEGRKRRIVASISIPCSVEKVWQVLTDYDNLSNFIPNLTLSRRIERPESGCFLEQVGSQCFLNIQFCARVVLQMAEHFPSYLGFSMVEGDFRTFEGAWQLTEDLTNPEATRLTYEVIICPPRVIPAALIERHLRHDLTQNLQAIRTQSITMATLPA
jgi:ribosome-associated toxin RatA of RatAB toxin-antitoxin module